MQLWQHTHSERYNQNHPEASKMLNQILEAPQGNSTSNSTFYYTQRTADWPKQCIKGREQSPIHIPLASDVRRKYDYNGIKQSPNIQFSPSYASIPKVQVKDLDHTIAAFGEFGNLTFTTPKNQLFKDLFATEVRVHAPSEHMLNEVHMDMEIQIIHKDRKTGQVKAIVAVLLDQAQVHGGNVSHNSFLQHFVLNGTDSHIVKDFNLSELIKTHDSGNKHLFYYPGSLTTPPCTEGVSWLVFDKVQPLSNQQLDYFYKRWPKNNTFAMMHQGNNRPVNPLGPRKIYQKFDKTNTILDYFLDIFN
eukprot:403369281